MSLFVLVAPNPSWEPDPTDDKVKPDPGMGTISFLNFKNRHTNFQYDPMVIWIKIGIEISTAHFFLLCLDLLQVTNK